MHITPGLSLFHDHLGKGEGEGEVWFERVGEGKGEGDVRGRGRRIGRG